MALRKIALQGEECLTKVCRPVTEFNDRLHTLLDDMAETLEEAGGVGLAAPQVGILRRVCIVLNEDDEIIELINPEIVYTEGEETALEGCLFVEHTDHLMEGEELQQWLADHADQYEIEDAEVEEEE